MESGARCSYSFVRYNEHADELNSHLGKETTMETMEKDAKSLLQ